MTIRLGTESVSTTPKMYEGTMMTYLILPGKYEDIKQYANSMNKNSTLDKYQVRKPMFIQFSLVKDWPISLFSLRTKLSIKEKSIVK